MTSPDAARDSQSAGAAASQLRRDPIRGHWTIIAPERADRPIVATDAALSPDASADDPFLVGNESETPAAVFSVPGDAHDWAVRVVPNRYPVVTDAASPSAATHELFESAPAGGRHEVIIECPEFETEFTALGSAQVARVLQAWQSRLAAVREAGRCDYAVIFKNNGARAGASLPHVHSQLLAMQRTPPQIEVELNATRDFFLREGKSLQDHVRELEFAADRGVLENSEIAAFCPFASRFSGETWLVPREAAAFPDLTPGNLESLAESLLSVIGAILTEHPGAAYNVVLHATPFSVATEPWFRWRLEVCPRLATLAGFETATGCFINAVPPERAAAALRKHC